MRSTALLLLAALIAGCASTAPSQNVIKRLDGSKIQAQELTSRIEELTKKANVHGLAITIFNDREIVYSRAFGVKNMDTGEPLRMDTVFYGASLSKAVSAVLFMKLAEDGILDLDTPLVSYLDQPVSTLTASREKAWHEDLTDLKDDVLHKKITARMCLSHTAGFPNWRWDEPDQKLRVKFEPGSRYSYSGEGFTFLQVILEKHTKKPLEEWMKEKIFEPYGMATSSYTWQPRFEANYCHGHDEKGEVLEKDKDNAARAPSTLETTPEDYARFIHAVLNRKGLKESSWNEMFSPQIRLRSKSQFGPLAAQTTTDNDDIELSYGLGWGLLTTPYGWGAFKEGHGDGFEHYSIIFPESGMGVVLMTNSANGESVFKELLEVSIADVYTPWQWQNYVPYDQPQ
ncbi:MAG: serine-type D-Ala-D-Ala carboxypeptidase/endopeptidase [Acidobacteriota bacterium]|jgi:CubicO group peptidase (beta-lactamase class C family)|nr:serine-type D-Ala-D-Ala carboxypeptidase/endopeptidase [Acidobacteriota bacterium]